MSKLIMSKRHNVLPTRTSNNWRRKSLKDAGIQSKTFPGVVYR